MNNNLNNTNNNQNNYQQFFQNNNNQYQQTSQDKIINNDILIDAYIGTKSNKIRNNKFSIWTLFFGVYWALNRKMWSIGIIWFLTELLIKQIVPSIFGILHLGFNIYAATQIHKWYLKFVNENIEKIIKENPNKTPEQLVNICNKKGGVSFWAVAVFIIIYNIIF